MELTSQLRPEYISKRQRDSEIKLEEVYSSVSFAHKRSRGTTLAPVNLEEMLEIEDVPSGNSNVNCLDEPSQEDLVSDVMKSLEEEIGSSDCSTLNYPTEGCMPSPLEERWCYMPNENSTTVDERSLELNSPPTSVSLLDGAHDNDYGSVDICFLLNASDEQLGLAKSFNSASEEYYDDSVATLCTARLYEQWHSGTGVESSESFWTSENVLEFPCVDDGGDQDWLKRAILTVETLMVPSATQTAVQESATPVLEAGAGS